MLVVGCARRVENIEKLASQLTQNTGKVTQFCNFNPNFRGEDCVDQLLCYNDWSLVSSSGFPAAAWHKTNLNKLLLNLTTQFHNLATPHYFFLAICKKM